jgi:hypothetical protein
MRGQKVIDFRATTSCFLYKWREFSDRLRGQLGWLDLSVRAGDGGLCGSGAANSLNAAPLSANTSQRSFLTTRHA